MERNLEERTKLRNMLSDYLIEQMDEPWMIDILIAPQELDGEEVKRAKSENNPPLPPLNRPPNATDGGELEQPPAKTTVEYSSTANCCVPCGSVRSCPSLSEINAQPMLRTYLLTTAASDS